MIAHFHLRGWCCTTYLSPGHRYSARQKPWKALISSFHILGPSVLRESLFFFFVGLTGYGSKLVAPKKRQLTVKMKWNDIKWHKMTKNMWSPWSLAHLQWKWPWRWRKITILLKTSLYIYRASKFGDASTFKIALKESMDFLGTEIVGKDTEFLFLTWGITVLHHRNGMVQAYWVLPFGWLVVPNSQGRKIVESCSI